MTPASSTLTTRRYEQADEPDVLDLLSSAMGGGPAGTRTPELFGWKHCDNPFGPSYLLVAEADDLIVGLRAFMRWSFRSAEGTVRAVRAVDTATHPRYQGRGIFSRLTSEAIDAIRADTDLVFNTPNEKSFPGYVKMGWRTVGTLPISVRVRRPVRVLRGLRDVRAGGTSSPLPPSSAGEAALEAVADPGLGALLEEAEGGSENLGLRTQKDEAYLRWRYGQAPSLDYRAIREHSGGALTGVAFFRVRPRGRLLETTVSEVLVRPGDEATARRLLGRVVRAAEVDHASCRFAGGTAAARAARRRGFLPTGRGMMFVINRIGRRQIEPDPHDLRSWALTLGDLEVF
jgi:GNAT superfamily N-acetyltransferase